MKKRIISFILAAVMLVSGVILSSCKDSTSVIDAKPKAGALTTKSLTNIYSAEAVSVLGTVFENVEIGNVIPFADGRLIVTGYDNETYETRYFITDISFKDANELKLARPSNDQYDEYVNTIAADAGHGVIWYVRNTYYYGESIEYPIANDDIAVEYGQISSPMIRASTAAVAEIITEDAVVMPEDFEYTEPKNETVLVKMDTDGNILSELPLDDILLIEHEDGTSYNGWIGGMIVLGDSLVLNIDGTKLCVIDSESVQVKKEIKFEEDTYINSVFAGSDGKLYYTSYGENGMEIHEYDIDAEKAVAFDMPIGDEQIYNYNILAGGGGYDILLTDDMALYGYNAGDEEITEICNYANSDLDISYGVVPVFLDESRLFISYYDYNESENVSLILTKVPPEEVKEKYLITVAAGSYISREIKTALLKFNRTNDEYKVVFKDYSEYNNESNGWNGANDKLAEDIVNNAEGAADIVLFDSYFDYESLTTKGALVDLNMYIESDDSFNRDEYLSNVFEALEKNGKLYMLTPTVNFQTMAVSKSFAAGRTSWTMKEFLEAHNSLGEGETLIAEVTREGVGSSLLQIVIDEFIDEATGRCSFNSDEFKSLLEYLKDIPADYSAYEELWQDNNYWIDQEMSYSKGTTKMYPVYISNFDMIPELEARFGEEVVLIGFPTNKEGSSGTIITPGEFLAINSSSKVTAGAWAAIKYLFTDEHQNKYAGEIDEYGSANSSYRFPLKVSMIDKKKENDLMPQFWIYTDENGEEVKEEFNNTMWLGESQIELRDSTDEDAERVYASVKGAKTALLSREALIDIISQEAEAFYNGEKSVDEVADIINSRVQLYVSERM